MRGLEGGRRGRVRRREGHEGNALKGYPSRLPGYPSEALKGPLKALQPEASKPPRHQAVHLHTRSSWTWSFPEKPAWLRQPLLGLPFFCGGIGVVCIRFCVVCFFCGLFSLFCGRSRLPSGMSVALGSYFRFFESGMFFFFVVYAVLELYDFFVKD